MCPFKQTLCVRERVRVRVCVRACMKRARSLRDSVSVRVYWVCKRDWVPVCVFVQLRSRLFACSLERECVLVRLMKRCVRRTSSDKDTNEGKLNKTVK